ncbi:MAG: 2OG-Fe(II) oxygenase [Pseudomonadota bacterium]
MVILPAIMPAEITNSLQQELTQLGAGAFHRAAVGRGQAQTVNRFVRQDRIYWIDEASVNTKAWLSWTESLRQFLNRRLYLGLFSFESHFAVYEPGAFYKRHLDAFRGEKNRVLSVVLYLNQGWAPDQGGELVIYEDMDGTGLRVTPELGTLVLFLSEEFPHEVLPANRHRYSVAGWYRLNTSAALEQIDPPQ